MGRTDPLLPDLRPKLSRALLTVCGPNYPPAGWFEPWPLTLSLLGPQLLQALTPFAPLPPLHTHPHIPGDVRVALLVGLPLGAGSSRGLHCGALGSHSASDTRVHRWARPPWARLPRTAFLRGTWGGDRRGQVSPLGSSKMGRGPSHTRPRSLPARPGPQPSRPLTQQRWRVARLIMPKTPPLPGVLSQRQLFQTQGTLWSLLVTESQVSRHWGWPVSPPTGGARSRDQGLSLAWSAPVRGGGPRWGRSWAGLASSPCSGLDDGRDPRELP